MEDKPQEHRRQPRIFIDKEGNWFQEDIPISHRRTYLYNNSLLAKDEEDRYYIDEGRGRIYIEVEDAPFVVRTVEEKEDGLYIILNDETSERLDFERLWIGDENVPYCKVKGGLFHARFLRPAYYELMKYLEYDEEKGEYFIETEKGKHQIKK